MLKVIKSFPLHTQHSHFFPFHSDIVGTQLFLKNQSCLISLTFFEHIYLHLRSKVLTFCCRNSEIGDLQPLLKLRSQWLSLIWEREFTIETAITLSITIAQMTRNWVFDSWPLALRFTDFLLILMLLQQLQYPLILPSHLSSLVHVGLLICFLDVRTPSLCPRALLMPSHPRTKIKPISQ